MKKQEKIIGSKHSEWRHRSSSREVVCIDINVIRELLFSLDCFDLEMSDTDQVKYFERMNSIFGYLDKIREVVEKQGYDF